MAQQNEQQRDRGDRGGRGRGRGRDRDQERDDELVDKLVHINRVAKTVKGGRNFQFAALVVVGDTKGRVGFGQGKAREVPGSHPQGDRRGEKDDDPRAAARGSHPASRHQGAPRRRQGDPAAAPPGTGVIAGGPMRAVLESLGVQDVVAKSVGTSNPYNMIRATMDALRSQSSPRSVAAKRGLKVGDLVNRRDDGASSPEAIEA